MSEKQKKKVFQRPPTDVMTHGAIWFILSIVFFILNYYGQSVLGYSLSDPQIYQFFIAPVIWGTGVAVHAFAARLLNKVTPPLQIQRGLRHRLRDIHIGVFVAFFVMLFSMGLTASLVGTGELNVASTLLRLIPWAAILGLHSWIVRLLDERHIARNKHDNAQGAQPVIDVARLVQDAGDFDQNDILATEDNPEQSTVSRQL